MTITQDFRTGHRTLRTQTSGAGPEEAARIDQSYDDDQQPVVSAGKGIRTGQCVGDAQNEVAGPEQDSRTDHRGLDGHHPAVGAGEDTAAAISGSESIGTAPLLPDSPNGHSPAAHHCWRAVGGTGTATPANALLTSKGSPPESAAKQGQLANDDSPPSVVVLADPTLDLAADVLDDLERNRIANENRLRQLTRDEADADGDMRGFGLTDQHPDVKQLADIVASLAKIERQATLNLQRAMRKHPLGPWVKAQKGVGEKQAARLLAAIGDPYWNDLHDRPRTVSELWAYCGLHTLPIGHPVDRRSHSNSADGASSSGGDQSVVDTQTLDVAARRKKGERANWSTAAKMRAYNIAESMLKAGNRETYDRRKAATEGRVHAVACVRCGPSGKPAQPGTSWSDAHRHADALRIVSKELLKQLWRAARDIHHGQSEGDDLDAFAVVGQAMGVDR